jgi:hypothetical protein
MGQGSKLKGERLRGRADNWRWIYITPHAQQSRGACAQTYSLGEEFRTASEVTACQRGFYKEEVMGHPPCNDCQ